MSQPALTIPATDASPVVHFYANPIYSLYHYLVKQGQLFPPQQRFPDTAPAASLMGRARTPRGAHGAWDYWELSVAMSTTLDDAADGLKAAMATTAEQIGEALRQAESIYLETIWPQRIPLIDTALTTLHERLVPHFSAMIQRQAALLDLAFPTELDAFLVGDCYDWRGGYSFPLTIDVTNVTGLDLCETVIHEATHKAEWHTLWTVKRQSLGDRLKARLAHHNLQRNAIADVWHAVVFAASAEQVRTAIDPAHVDYASTHNSPTNTLYGRFNVPELPAWWGRFASGMIDEQSFFDGLADQVVTNTRVVSL